MAGYKQIEPRYKKGESGNPNGRPKILPELKAILTDILSEVRTNDKGKSFTGLEIVLRSLHSKAAKGDVRAIQEILDRFYGKVTQQIDTTTKGESINKTPIFGDNPLDKNV